MGVLEYEGFKALKAEAKAYLRDSVVSKINAHITKEVGKIMTELSDLRGAVDKELADDAAQNELIEELKRQLDAALAAQQAEADARAAAEAGEADAEQRLAQAQSDLTEALDAAREAAGRLASNDAPAEPFDEDPVDEPVDPGTPEPENPQA